MNIAEARSVFRLIKAKSILVASIAALLMAACTPAAGPVPAETALPAPTVTPLPPTPTTAPSPTDIPRILNPQNGHWYLAVYTVMGWNGARDYCRRMKGDLVTITSEQENQFVYSLNANSWIGLSDTAQEGNWEWVTGEPLDYVNWAESEPNNCTDCKDIHVEEGEDYAHFNQYPPDQWNDWPPEISSFVCEWDASK